MIPQAHRRVIGVQVRLPRADARGGRRDYAAKVDEFAGDTYETSYAYREFIPPDPRGTTITTSQMAATHAYAPLHRLVRTRSVVLAANLTYTSTSSRPTIRRRGSCRDVEVLASTASQTPSRPRSRASSRPLMPYASATTGFEQ